MDFDPVLSTALDNHGSTRQGNADRRNVHWSDQWHATLTRSGAVIEQQ